MFFAVSPVLPSRIGVLAARTVAFWARETRHSRIVPVGGSAHVNRPSTAGFNPLRPYRGTSPIFAEKGGGWVGAVIFSLTSHNLPPAASS